MESKERQIFEQAVNVVSTRLKLILLRIDDEKLSSIQEIRLRSEKPVAVFTDGGSFFITEKGTLTKIFDSKCIITSYMELNDTVNRVCNYSIHSHQENINNGFVTVKGGHRVGLVGTYVKNSEGKITVKDISSVNIRISRQIFGSSEIITDSLLKNGLQNIIIAGPPSSGKTTVLRDLAFRLSSGYIGEYFKTAVLDERGEFSASYSGSPQNDLGLNSDVLLNYPKTKGIEIALRSLSPEYIIFDEICSEDDVSSIKNALNTGVKFALSIHCGSEEELKNKDLLNLLLNTGSFKYAVLLSSLKPGRIDKIFSIETEKNEIYWSDFNISL